jgi:MAF protein
MSAIVLASGSRYRAELLQKLKLDFVSCNSKVDETAIIGESAEDLVLRLSKAKAEAVGLSYPNHLIIGSDQVAVCGKDVLTKPGDRSKAIEQLKVQSGQVVRFYTGVCVLNSMSGVFLSDIDICSVQFRTLTNEQIRHYVDLEKPFDCAGSFKSEGLGIALFSGMDVSDPNALIGLPLIKLIDILAKFGVSII